MTLQVSRPRLPAHRNTQRPALFALSKAYSRHLSRLLYPTAKRTLDLTVASIVLIAVLPLLILVALAIKLESPGPIFFRQVRVGRSGRLFQLWKFRSMVVDAESARKKLENKAAMSGGIRFKLKRDPRITRVGYLIRRFSIDELPQLLNVLRGDMSLVGPRPPIPSEVEAYDLTARRRLDCVPGLTCIWQVSGRSLIPFERQVQMDIDYEQHQSLGLDMRLLLQTVPAVLLARGAC
ncbi:MAG: sugar transferase [Thermoanaerobaculia bacterium]|nr:sugar transferase [Thermoanaerobaculia bacterium]